MLRVTLDMIPEGDEAKKEQVGIMEIVSLQDNTELVDYSYRWVSGEQVITGIVYKFPKQTGVWAIFHRVLQEILTGGLTKAPKHFII